MSSAQVDLLGLRIDALTEAQVIERVLDDLRAGRGGRLFTVNLDILRQCSADPAIMSLVDDADLVLPDGAPLVWASRLAGTPVPERVAGSTLVVSLTAAAARADRSVFLLGGNPGTADAAGERMSAAHRDLRIAGTRCPPFGFERDAAQLGALEEAVVAADPDIVYVGLGFPKQEHLIARLQPLLPRTWFVSCGISFSFLSGEVRRAPVSVQRLGLEWLHRLVQEPRRLARRYLVDGPPFVLKLIAASLRRRLRPLSK